MKIFGIDYNGIMTESCLIANSRSNPFKQTLNTKKTFYEALGYLRMGYLVKRDIWTDKEYIQLKSLSIAKFKLKEHRAIFIESNKRETIYRMILCDQNNKIWKFKYDPNIIINKKEWIILEGETK